MRDGLGWDQPKANGSYYSATQAAYRCDRGFAGEEVAYILPDGGMYYIDGERVDHPEGRAHRRLRGRVRPGPGLQGTPYYAKLRHDEWTVQYGTRL